VANALANAFRQDLVGADIDLLADTIKVVVVDSGYTFNAAHDNLDDVIAGARVATSAALGAKTGTNGYFDSSDVVFTALASGDTITGLWLFKDTGVETTSRLIAWYDTNASAAAISVATNGGDISIVPSSSGWLRV
jgi:hypothetical protein